VRKDEMASDLVARKYLLLKEVGRDLGLRTGYAVN
jgi:hypothetical protein